MAKVHCLLLCLFALLPTCLWGQEPKQPVRLELPYKLEETEVELMALPDSSLLVYSKTSNVWGTQATFLFEKYNAQLERVWSKEVELEPDSYFERFFTEQPYTYIAFSSDDTRNYKFLKIDLATGAIQATAHKIETIDLIYEYNVLQGRYFVIGRNRQDEKPVLLHINPEKDEIKLLPTIYAEESSFSDLLADAEHQRVDAVLTESNGRISRLQVKSFDADGELINNFFILQQEDKSLLNAEATPGDSATKMLVGTYGTRDLRYSKGFFVTPVASRGEEATFYNLLQLKNSFKFMKPKREKRFRQREAQRLKAGKEPTFRYRFLLHDLISTPTGYVLAAEVYYPQYRNSGGYMDASVRGGSRWLAAYKRTHAIAAGFDRNGVLLWDNSFRLRDLSTPELTHAIEVAYTLDGRMIMAYPEEDQIIYSVMQQDSYSDEKTFVDLKTYEEKEKITSTEEPRLIPWYGSSFAAYGFQRVKSSGNGTRSVFYINKITF
ncbi:hypothetical protein [Pontibacter ruber]|uniref:Uncharacterized protein n=1 Tax=Pontibacter ruber TaxID=1343895 RepID=A0ABW5CWR9_9BACT|nr:hypothetical protein [Pontibacter ruber]